MPVSLQQLKDAWPQIVEAVQNAKRSAWMVAVTATPRGLSEDNVLALSFPSQNDVDSFKERSGTPGEGVSDTLRNAILQVLGIRVRFTARADGPPPAATRSAPAPKVEPGGWATVAIPNSGSGAGSAPSPAPDRRAPASTPPAAAEAPNSRPSQSARAPQPTARANAPRTSAAPGAHRPDAPTRSAAPPDWEPPEPDEPEPDWTRSIDESFIPADESPGVPATPSPDRTAPPAGHGAPVNRNGGRGGQPGAPARSSKDAAGGGQRYGESVVREILGASFIEEKPVTRSSRPTIRPTGDGG